MGLGHHVLLLPVLLPISLKEGLHMTDTYMNTVTWDA